MRNLIIIGLVFIQSLGFAQESVSPFISIPTIAQQIKNISEEKDLMEIYANFENDYPEDKFAQVHFLMDQVYIAASEKLVAWGNSKALNYIIKIQNAQDRNRLLEALPADSWQQTSAESVITSLRNQIHRSKSQLQQQNFVYAEILMYAGKHKEALNYLREQKDLSALIATHPYLFIDLYRRNNEPELALPILAEIIQKGKGNEESKHLLQDLWEQKHGNVKGFETYYEEQLSVLRKSKEVHLSDGFLSYEAPDFELKDVQGNVVSLKELRDKVVFLDFWATWCGPCLASFPTMQRVVDHYKDNKEVVFLFVNTMERDPAEQDRIKKIKNLMNEKSWNFQVVLDQKSGSQYELVEKYKVNGIPAQFVIDKNGKVRYALKGFNGSTDGLIQEINVLVQSALKF